MERNEKVIKRLGWLKGALKELWNSPHIPQPVREDMFTKLLQYLEVSRLTLSQGGEQSEEQFLKPALIPVPDEKKNDPNENE